MIILNNARIMDTPNTHLVAVARSLVLSDEEQNRILTSISTLQTHLNSWFGNDVSKHFRFGSSVRETILPRKADEGSDIDYMVVFNNQYRYKPATLLDKLRAFADYYYSRSEIHQDHPTMVLELNHIKFELVPSYQDYSWSDSYYIPAPSSDYADWMSTNPTDIHNKVNNANSRYNYQIKRLIRLLKYWNVRNYMVYSSYELEDHLASRVFYLCTSLEDYFYDAVSGLPIYMLPQYKIDKVKKLQDKVAEIRKDYYDSGYKYLAMDELAKLFPMP